MIHINQLRLTACLYVWPRFSSVDEFITNNCFLGLPWIAAKLTLHRINTGLIMFFPFSAQSREEKNGHQCFLFLGLDCDSPLQFNLSHHRFIMNRRISIRSLDNIKITSNVEFLCHRRWSCFLGGGGGTASHYRHYTHYCTTYTSVLLAHSGQAVQHSADQTKIWLNPTQGFHFKYQVIWEVYRHLGN